MVLCHQCQTYDGWYPQNLFQSSPVHAGSQHELHLEGHDSEGRTCIKAKHLVNAAGLWATQVATLLEGMPKAQIPKQHYARGVYFTMAGKLKACLHDVHASQLYPARCTGD